MTALLNNWKTSTAGAVVIALGVMHYFGVTVPGFTMDIGPAITAGIGLIFAHDA